MSGIMLNLDDSAFFFGIHKGYGESVKDKQEAIAYTEVKKALPFSGAFFMGAMW